MTNREKFKQVFGYDVDTKLCPFGESVWNDCEANCKYLHEEPCEFCTDLYWNDEYKEVLEDGKKSD